MTSHLGIAVIAEGVENQQQCQHFQGFLFGKPVPIAIFDQVIRDAVT